MLLRDSLGADDWTLEVPACPGWKRAQVARTLARAPLGRGDRALRSEPGRPRGLTLGFPDGYAGYGDWIREGARTWRSRSARKGRPRQTGVVLGPRPARAFWSRRMLHETAMHRADIELALGRAPEFDPAVAADGIDEFLTVLPAAAAFAPKVRTLTGDGERCTCGATDGDPLASAEDRAEWLITLEPHGFRWRRAHAKGAPPSADRSVSCTCSPGDGARRAHRRSRRWATTRCWTTG